MVAGAIMGQRHPNLPETRFAIDANQFDTSSEDNYLQKLYIPGILSRWTAKCCGIARPTRLVVTQHGWPVRYLMDGSRVRIKLSGAGQTVADGERRGTGRYHISRISHKINRILRGVVRCKRVSFRKNTGKPQHLQMQVLTEKNLGRSNSGLTITLVIRGDSLFCPKFISEIA